MGRTAKTVAKLFGIIMAIEGVFMIPAMVTASYYREATLFTAFVILTALLISLGILTLVLLKDAAKVSLSMQNAYAIASIVWLGASVVGMLPYLASGYTTSIVDAFFESVAGFTTTGATVNNVDIMPRSLMMWKACTHWVGGMGILVLAVSVFPTLGISGRAIFRAEAPGPTVDKYSSRFSDSTKILYGIYLAVTIIEFLLLLPSKMDTFDAIVNTLGNVSTAGLFSHSMGLKYYDSAYIEIVMSAGVVLMTINFSFYINLAQGKWRKLWDNRELQLYLGMILFSGLLISAVLYRNHNYESLAQSLRHGLLQTVAFASTVGYSIDNYNLWPPLCIGILMLLGFIGGCVSSTSGGLKIMRLIVVFKLIARGFKKRLHPRAVIPVKVGDDAVPADVVTLIGAYTFLYIGVFAAGTLILSLQGLPIGTTMGAAIAAISNTGATFGLYGTFGISDFSIFHPALKFVLSLMMLMGRLEIVSLLMLFMPGFWKK